MPPSILIPSPTPTREQYDILRHASRNGGRYVTSDPAVLEMARTGWFHDHGPWAIAGDDHALRLTQAGRDAINAYEAALPPPPKLSKRKQRARERYQRFTNWRDAWQGTFKQFLAYEKERGLA